jgi:CheY-like chemotaxis protein
MDVEMPVMDGITATRLIRGLEGVVRDVPIVAMTAHVLPEQVAGFRAAGANDHVGKPFDRAQLRTVIERCLVKTGPPVRVAA